MNDALAGPSLKHYGILRRSGRYPWGSGGDQKTRDRDFLGYVENLRKQGLSDTEIAKGLSTNDYRLSRTDLQAAQRIAKNRLKAADQSMAVRLKAKGMSNVAIGQRMGRNESSVRALLAASERDKVDVVQTTADMLRKNVDEKGFIDIGSGVENYFGVAPTALATAVSMLKEEGYTVHPVQIDQLGTAAGNKTTVRTLCKKGTTYKEAKANRDNIRQIQDFSNDGGRSVLGIKPPLSINSKRIAVRYAEQGGTDADGVIYVRPGVKDVSLDKSHYAQVRVMVDNSHYLKGMAMYKDDLPDGVDLMFNTAKSDTGNKLDAMKSLKDDPDNPFGAAFRRQITDEHGNVTSAMNLVNEEGNWETWSRNLSTQFLSKQSPVLAKKQLDLTYAAEKAKLDEILSLTNPTVRQKLLESYADGADSSAVHLKAAALPRQASHVILPINSMKETEVYAPNFNNGERVVLIRYPHGGTFEIPELTVNNNHPAAIKALGKRKEGHAPDAIGINSEVAKRLSGADFDGDSVIVIPQGAGAKVKTQAPLKDLAKFEPQQSYAPYDGMKTIDGGVYNASTKQVDYGTKADGTPKSASPKGKAMQMGIVSNLITDMTIKGAPNDELARAVRHSMVVIDAEKHHLNWQQSYKDNGISQLHEKYQGKKQGGSATIISRAKKKQTINKRDPNPAKLGGPVDKATGKKVFVDRAPFVNTHGQTVQPTQKVKMLEFATDAHSLVSDHGGQPIEKIYADHSNRMKALADQARKEAVNTKSPLINPSAKAAYAPEVQSLKDKLFIAVSNRPLERQAQVFANALVRQKMASNLDLDPAQVKRLKFQALDEARRRTGASKSKAAITLTDREWQAIQAGAIPKTILRDILNNTDESRVKELATPRSQLKMNPSTKARALTLLASGHTQAEVAQQLGIGLTTLKNGLRDT